MGIFGADLLAFGDAGLTLANTFSHLWCSPEGTGRPPGKLSFIIWAPDIPATNIIRQFGSGSLLEPRTWYVKSLMLPPRIP